MINNKSRFLRYVSFIIRKQTFTYLKLINRPTVIISWSSSLAIWFVAKEMGSSPISTNMFHYTSQIFLVFLFTTMLLMMYVARLQHEDQLRDATVRTTRELKEQMRIEKLRELQVLVYMAPVHRKRFIYIISLSQPKYTVDNQGSAKPDHKTGNITQTHQDSAKCCKQ